MVLQSRSLERYKERKVSWTLNPSGLERMTWHNQNLTWGWPSTEGELWESEVSIETLWKRAGWPKADIMCYNFIRFIAIMAFYQSQVSGVRWFVQEKLCLNFKKLIKNYFRPRAYRGKFESIKICNHTQKACRAIYFEDLLDFYTNAQEKEAQSMISAFGITLWSHLCMKVLWAENKFLIGVMNTGLKVPLLQWLKQVPAERTSLTWTYHLIYSVWRHPVGVISMIFLGIYFILPGTKITQTVLL